MRVRLLTVVLAVAMMFASGFFVARAVYPTSGHEHTQTDTAAAAPEVSQLETIFLALDQKEFPVPVERSGSGGALTSWNDTLLLLTHEGGFFDVTGDEALPLDFAAPENGWEDMLAFEEANPSYNFAHFYFRYNDVRVIDDRIFVSFTEWVADRDCYRNTIADAPFAGPDSKIEVADWSILFAAEPCLPPSATGRAIQGHMAGGRFDIGADGRIYLASGDYALDGNYADAVIARDPTTSYGKVLAIDPETGEASTLSQGHSNPQGIVATREGEVYTVEHGRRGGDELNRIVAGTDFGWPTVSLGTRYNRLPLPNTLEYGRHPEFPLPVFAWLPSVAPSSLIQIDGFHPSWDGDLLAGTLAGRSLIRIRIVDGRVLFDERISIGKRIRHIHQFGDQIVLWTDSETVMKLSIGEFDPSAQFAVATIAGMGLSPQQQTNTQVALDQCIECHSLGVVAGGSAPALGGVYGRDIAAGSYDYTEALQAAGGTWTAEALTAYLSDPQTFAPGTSMPNPEIGNPDVVAALVDVLQALREAPE